MQYRCPSCLGAFDALSQVTLLDNETPICDECRMVEELYVALVPDLPLIDFQMRHEAESLTETMRHATAEEVEEFTVSGFPADALLDHKGDVLVPLDGVEAA